MTIFDRVYAHFDGNLAAIGDALGVSRQRAHQWKASGRIPIEHARALERVTGGHVIAEEVFDEYLEERERKRRA